LLAHFSLLRELTEWVTGWTSTVVYCTKDNAVVKAVINATVKGKKRKKT